MDGSRSSWILEKDPLLKMEALKREIGILEERLKEKKIESTEVLDIGDGWHDNNAFDIAVEEQHLLNAQLRILKSELVKLRKC